MLKEYVNKKIKIITVILAVLLVLSLGYIVYGKFVAWNQQKDVSNFQSGAQYGYEQAVSQLFQQVQSCEQVPIFVNNQTINIVAVECLSPQTSE